jgi:hypothetical protein
MRGFGGAHGARPGPGKRISITTAGRPAVGFAQARRRARLDRACRKPYSCASSDCPSAGGGETPHPSGPHPVPMPWTCTHRARCPAQPSAPSRPPSPFARRSRPAPGSRLIVPFAFRPVVRVCGPCGSGLDAAVAVRCAQVRPAARRRRSIIRLSFAQAGVADAPQTTASLACLRRSHLCRRNEHPTRARCATRDR